MLNSISKRIHISAKLSEISFISFSSKETPENVQRKGILFENIKAIIFTRDLAATTSISRLDLIAIEDRRADETMRCIRSHYEEIFYLISRASWLNICCVKCKVEKTK